MKEMAHTPGHHKPVVRMEWVSRGMSKRIEEKGGCSLEEAVRQAF